MKRIGQILFTNIRKRTGCKSLVCVPVLLLTLFVAFTLPSCNKTDGTYICHCEIKDSNNVVIGVEDSDTQESSWSSAAISCEATKAVSAGIHTSINKKNSVSCSLQ